MQKAERSSWKTEPSPVRRKKLSIDEQFSSEQYKRMKQGLIPSDMDDRWFVFFEDGWLNFYRSWTGHHICALQLGETPSGARVLDGWISREKDEYGSEDIEHDREMILRIIQSLAFWDAKLNSTAN